MEVWHVMGLRTPLREIAERARRVEDMGFDVLAVPDIIHDGPISAALAVAATRRMRIATSGLIAFPRSPMMVAVAAWDLQESSDGRFLLGLGPQVRGNIVSRYGTTWTPPAPRMREYVQSLRAIFDRWQHGTPLDFRGEHYRFTRMQPFTSPLPIEHPEIPIHLAGIGPNMTALAGELAEGLMTHPTSASPRFLGEFTRPHLERGAYRVGRELDDSFGVTINPLCATGRSEAEVAAAREAHRETLATLFSTPSYWPSLDLHGWRELGEQLHGRVREERWPELAELIDDGMLDTFVPAARHGELAACLIERYAGLGNAITLPIPEDPADDAEMRAVVARLQEAG